MFTLDDIKFLKREVLHVQGVNEHSSIRLILSSCIRLEAIQPFSLVEEAFHRIMRPHQEALIAVKQNPISHWKETRLNCMQNDRPLKDGVSPYRVKRALWDLECSAKIVKEIIEDGPWRDNTHCKICGNSVRGVMTCKTCTLKLPPSLVKACGDQPWNYALGLEDGTIIEFSGAEINGPWVTIVNEFAESPKEGFQPPLWNNHCYPRGIDIRFDQIVWCADAPDGS